ncbi:MAG: hypothetical protein L3J95_02390 [Thermoplasmata archaeon]|nr:hypothetical protein [Thermoplasmata archaeon]MCI4359256.1 hypothetical protein [Thermoplasmata archaeon]
MFYNGAMALDRDLSVAVANALASRAGPRSWAAWEMLAATGVRALRVLNESGLFSSVLLTEANPSAYRVLEANVARFGPERARALLRNARSPPPDAPFDFIDLDPYGSPAPFVSSCFDSARIPSVLAVTATDLRVLAGADPTACERRYGARPLRGRLAPEGGLRILLGWLARQARSRGVGLRPLLAYVGGHYLRAYVELFDEAADRDFFVSTVDPRDFTGPSIGGTTPVGPLWTSALVDPAFVDLLEVPRSAARPREAARLLELLQGEARVEAMFFFEANELAREEALASPPRVDEMIRRLSERGWPTARTHVRAGGFRTTAPRAEVAKVAREVAEPASRTRPEAG